MKKQIGLVILLFVVSAASHAQKIYTKNAGISFFSKTSMENISAENNQVMAVLNTQNGELQFSVLVKSFHFEKALMEEHFNENYLESEKFPKATFKGTIENNDKVTYASDGQYKITATGDLNIHGVTKKISIPAIISVKGGKVSADSKFMVKLSDFNVSIPKLVKDNIAESIELKVTALFDQKL